ncbi:uncharacterized protein LOC108905784 [Anoplophora glabripennis]|uniref:uncharacterized protein LOC108905784 n=1 Tax=Anoplophora glabripennis TaxID=217634 RepID=UPI000874EDFE|nr:uncharacterized protein LOC108905784 [Anoplophora glabripennis]
MSENSTAPYVLQLKDAVSAIRLSENDISNIALSVSQPADINILPSSSQKLEQVCLEKSSKISAIGRVVDVDMEVETQNVNEQVNFVYEIVYPEHFNLKPIYNLKRGRPKKKKVEELPVEISKNVKPVPRTRSGRVVKFPKYIEKDFKKMETEDGALYSEEHDVKTTEFERFEEDNKQVKKTNEIQLEFHQRKRKISAQYRCPKCKKAYLGKSKMIQHIKKYPDHGPIPHNELNFDVWNYLVDITQKCPSAQRGIKFCEELTNLLHNVLLLTSALFKKVEQNKNYVDVDKVLGNAIGLPPGPYKFNDSELYKDVTVLKLITNSDFFKPVNTDEGAGIDKNVTVVNKSRESEEVEAQKTESSSYRDVKVICDHTKGDEEKTDLYFRTHGDDFSMIKTQNNITSEEVQCIPVIESSVIINNFEKGNVETAAPSSFIKKTQSLDNRLPVHTDLLSDNSLLNLPNLRNSVDELILSGVDSSANLLDNSTSSDDVMNVDQFVNERFKKITEPEMEHSLVYPPDGWAKTKSIRSSFLV